MAVFSEFDLSRPLAPKHLTAKKNERTGEKRVRPLVLARPGDFGECPDVLAMVTASLKG